MYLSQRHDEPHLPTVITHTLSFTFSWVNHIRTPALRKLIGCFGPGFNPEFPKSPESPFALRASSKHLVCGRWSSNDGEFLLLQSCVLYLWTSCNLTTCSLKVSVRREMSFKHGSCNLLHRYRFPLAHGLRRQSALHVRDACRCGSRLGFTTQSRLLSFAKSTCRHPLKPRNAGAWPCVSR